MSANKIIIKSAFAMVATAGLTLTAYAGNGSSRYGGPSVYDYESGGNCGAACAQGAYQAPQQHIQAAPVASRYGSDCGSVAVNNCAPQVYQQPAVSPGVVYVDCATYGTCAPQPTYQQQTYQAPAPVYSQPTTYAQSYNVQSYGATQADCPAGTTAQSDGTCLQSSYSAQSYSSTPTYSSGTSYSSPSTYSGETVACPAGTSQQSDGTCLQSGSSSSFGSTSSYSSGSSYSTGSSYSASSSFGSTPVSCPAGTTAQSDGTCLEGSNVSSYTGGTATIFSGDAAPSYGGYTSDGGYTADSYLPIRK